MYHVIQLVTKEVQPRCLEELSWYMTIVLLYMFFGGHAYQQQFIMCRVSCYQQSLKQGFYKQTGKNTFNRVITVILHYGYTTNCILLYTASIIADTSETILLIMKLDSQYQKLPNKGHHCCFQHPLCLIGSKGSLFDLLLAPVFLRK